MGCGASTTTQPLPGPVKESQEAKTLSATARSSGGDSDYGEDSDCEDHSRTSILPGKLKVLPPIGAPKPGPSPTETRLYSGRDSNTTKPAWIQRRAWTDTVSVCQYCIAVDGGVGAPRQEADHVASRIGRGVNVATGMGITVQVTLS